MLTPTLVDLLAHADITPRIYHLGRQVAPCPLEHFRAFEMQQIAWPRPWQSQAQVALVLTPAPGSDPVIWCLALALDEQSMLIPALRDGFLEQLTSTVGRGPDGHVALDSAAETLKDVAVALTPGELTRALLHARVSRDLGRAASRHHEPARAFYLGCDDAPPWQALGLQGIADLVVRRTYEEEEQLAHRLTELPDQALTALCDGLTHAPVEHEALLGALVARHETTTAASDPVQDQALTGAIVASALAGAADWLDTVLDRAPAASVLATIAARGWHHLEHERRSIDYLDSISRLTAHDFRVLIRDLTRIPRLRLPMIMAMKQARPDSPLGQQIDALQREPHG